MKKLVVFALLICVAFSVYAQSQSTNVQQQRYRALSDAMGTTLTRNTQSLADFDVRMGGSASTRGYTYYFREHNVLSSALRQSEFRLNFLLNNNAHSAVINEEHVNFEGLLKALEALKTNYDNWLRTAQ